MFNTQVVELMKTFSAYDMNSFAKFVISPFFNKNKKIISLFKILEKAHPKYTSESLLKEKLFKKLFPGEKYDDKKMRYLTYELLKLAEEFLGISLYRKDFFNFPVTDILVELGRRGQKNLFSKRVAIAEKNMDITLINKNAYFFNKWRLNSLKTYYENFFYGKPFDVSVLLEESELMILFAVINLTYVYHNLSIAKDTDNTIANSFMLNDFIRSVDLKSMADKARAIDHKYADLLEIYYLLIMIKLNDEVEDHYFRLKKIMQNAPLSVAGEDRYNIYTNLETYCVKKILAGKSEYIREAFDIYKFQLENNAHVLGEGESIGTILFYNVLQLGLGLKEFEWIEDFIKKYSTDLIPDDKENMLNFSYACLNFEKGDFKNVLSYISKVKIDRFFLKYEIKQISLRTYYELNEIESVLSLIDSSKHFLSKNKSVTDDRKVPFGNFLKFLGEIVKARIEREAVDPDQLRNEIQSEKIVIRKAWLLEKIDQLTNNNISNK